VFGFVRTIGFKLTIWFVSILALAILAVSALFYFGMQRVLLQAVDTNLRAAGLRSVTPDPTRSDKESDEELRQLILLSNTPARLLATDGTVLQTDPLFPTSITVSPEMLVSANAGDSRFETIQIPAGTYRLYTAPVRMHETHVAIVQVVNSLDEQMKTLREMRAVLAWLIPISLILAGIGGAFLAGRTLAPITRVRRKVELIIDQTDLSHRVSEGLPDDEVGRLARTFDQLLERVQQAMARERQFTSDASHELRTPLTVLKGELSVALSRPRPADEYRATLARLEPTVDDMSQLVEDLLTLTRAAANKENAGQERVNLTVLLLQVCERMKVLANAKGITLNAPPASAGLIALGDRLKLQRVLVNLIDNALRYTPKGGRVDVTIRRKEAEVFIDVRDTGRGIRPEHLPRLFQRFYRADSDRARDSGGSGLGLAITQAIVQAHHGRINVESQPGKGSCFTVCLPLADIEQEQGKMGASENGSTGEHKEQGRLRAGEIGRKGAEEWGSMGAPLLPGSLSPALPRCASRVELYDRTFRAMNTDVSLLLVSDARHAALALDAAEWFFLQTEWRLSRFRESSELSTLNRERSLQASRTLYEVVALAVQAYHDTGGVFNPLVGRALAAAGYDRSFDLIGTNTSLAPTGRPINAAPSLDDVLCLDPATRRITLQGEAQLDLGGIAKGWAIDRAYRTLRKLGACCVNAGGDVRAGGAFEPGGDGWRVDIADPFAPQATDESDATPHVLSVMLKDEAIATSGIVKRRWIMSGVEQHHLIDPRNGEPARNELLFVTSVGASAVQAEVAAKTIFILGEEAGSAWAQDRHTPALLMRRNGEYIDLGLQERIEQMDDEITV
jgi:heavy metal sensor kinase